MTLSTMTHLRWMCRRGMLELDFLLNRFLDGRYDALGHDDKVLFEKMLTEADPTLFAWMMGHQTPEPTYQHLIALIRHAG